MVQSDGCERIAQTIDCGQPGGAVDYTIDILEREGLRTGDEALLTIRTATETVALIGGNALQLTIASGAGLLHEVDISTGQRKTSFLYPSATLEVPTGAAYFYRNSLDPDHPLVVLDHCDGFDPANEPAAIDLLKGLMSSLNGNVPA